MNIGLVRRGYSATGGAEAYLKRFAQALLAAVVGAVVAVVALAAVPAGVGE